MECRYSVGLDDVGLQYLVQKRLCFHVKFPAGIHL